MAYRTQGESPKLAKPGELLVVVHEFEARGPDELSLVKGDRIELIERDDDFGDGWYLGKHMGDSRSGLFPEVYTKKAPSNVSDQTKRSFRSNSTPSAPSTYATSHHQHTRTPSASESKSDAAYPSMNQDNISQQVVDAPQYSEDHHYQATPSPLNTSVSSSQRTVSAPNSAYLNQTPSSAPPAQRSISLMMMENGHSHEEDSPVLNETLSVIDEHITDMNTPRSSMMVTDGRGFNDSGSEYSSHIGHRMSYINGNETDEEERSAHNQAEVAHWSPAQVAEYLDEAGVEAKHCEIFKEQEISGEVLLNLDQASIFMKELDLGPVGRRLRTWHKIRALQEEVQYNTRQQARRQLPRYGRNASAESLNGSTSQGSFNSSVLPRIPGMASPATRHIRQGSPLAGSYSPSSAQNPTMSMSGHPPDSPGRYLAATHGHSRRHSSIDAQAKINDQAPKHHKQPSLDRTWTMGSSSTSPVANRTSVAIISSSLGMAGHAVSPIILDHESTTDGARDVDHGYLSGGDAETRKMRNVLRKRESTSASHSRQSSNRDTNASATSANKRHSRFGSAGSLGKAFASVTSGRARSRSRTRASATESQSLGHPHNDISSPIVTHLDYTDSPTSSMKPNDSALKQDGSSQPSLVQSIAQSTTGTEKSVPPPTTDVALHCKEPVKKETPVESPSRTTSTTTSGASKSIEMEKGSPITVAAPLSGKRAKNKKQTSAYTRGLLKQTPQEAMLTCDYSGWMKKKSPSLIATWKPRLFVLRGKRLSYYYSEDDTEEQGLIDISNHKVLAADDLLTGIHAAVTGAKSSPTSPANAQTETKNAAEVAAQTDSTPQKPGDDSIFIFKLMPPRTGLSRAVNFTKPAIHYFAVDNIKQGRLWMAALMKATIEKDDTKPITSTYQQKTISLSKAKQMRQRPPALMNVDEDIEVKDRLEQEDKAEATDDAGLNIKGLNLSYEYIVSEAVRETNMNGRPASETPSSAPLSAGEQPDRPASADRLQTASTTTNPDSFASTLRMVKSHSDSLRDRGASEEPLDPTVTSTSGKLNRSVTNTSESSRPSTSASRTVSGGRSRALSGVSGTPSAVLENQKEVLFAAMNLG